MYFKVDKMIMYKVGRIAPSLEICVNFLRGFLISNLTHFEQKT